MILRYICKICQPSPRKSRYHAESGRKHEGTSIRNDRKRCGLSNWRRNHVNIVRELRVTPPNFRTPLTVPPGTKIQILERGKRNSLREHRSDSKESPVWHEEIASDSEAFVRPHPTLGILPPSNWLNRADRGNKWCRSRPSAPKSKIPRRKYPR